MAKSKRHDVKKMMWGNLIHLSFNMWADRPVKKWGGMSPQQVKHVSAHPYLRFDESLYRDLTERMVEVGMNTVLLDVGDAVKFKSHPEISVKGAWSHAKLRKELDRLRKMGIEPLPKLNFSAGHDAWLGEYSRCLSTPIYYRVCSDLIEEVAQLFDRPRLFHLGYDEETFGNQTEYDFAAVRQHELWWHDFEFFIKQVRKQGSRPWIWSDYAWGNHDTFYARMPRYVMQSNWWYWPDMSYKKHSSVRTFTDLEKHKYDQIPTCSNWADKENCRTIVRYCMERVDPSRLKGFLQTVWLPTLELFREKQMEAIELMGQVIAELN